MRRKKYGIYDLNHHSFFKFGFEGGEEFDFFSTKEECKEAIKLCKILFFNGYHKFVIKPHWEKYNG